MHDHSHHRDSHPHAHSASGRPLMWSLFLTLAFAAVEAGAGWWSGSLALLSDAGHMLTDATALGFAWLATWVAAKPPSAKHSYGLGRAEPIAAVVNGVFMIAIVLGIVVSAIQRLQEPQPVQGGAVMAVAVVGLVINIAVMYLLSRGEQTLNTRGAVLHVMGDMLGSVAALLSGAVIYFTGWMPIDPILSIFICALILSSSLRLLRESLHIIMEGVPAHLNLREVGQAMARVEGVDSVHDLHIWTLAGGKAALSAHLVIRDLSHWQSILDHERHLLEEHFDVAHVTLQPELGAQGIQPIPFIREPGS